MCSRTPKAPPKRSRPPKPQRRARHHCPTAAGAPGTVAATTFRTHPRRRCRCRLHRRCRRPRGLPLDPPGRQCARSVRQKWGRDGFEYKVRAGPRPHWRDIFQIFKTRPVFKYARERVRARPLRHSGARHGTVRVAGAPAAGKQETLAILHIRAAARLRAGWEHRMLRTTAAFPLASFGLGDRETKKHPDTTRLKRSFWFETAEPPMSSST